MLLPFSSRERNRSRVNRLVPSLFSCTRRDFQDRHWQPIFYPVGAVALELCRLPLPRYPEHIHVASIRHVSATFGALSTYMVRGSPDIDRLTPKCSTFKGGNNDRPARAHHLELLKTHRIRRWIAVALSIASQPLLQHEAMKRVESSW